MSCCHNNPSGMVALGLGCVFVLVPAPTVTQSREDITICMARALIFRETCLISDWSGSSLKFTGSGTMFLCVGPSSMWEGWYYSAVRAHQEASANKKTVSSFNSLGSWLYSVSLLDYLNFIFNKLNLSKPKLPSFLHSARWVIHKYKVSLLWIIWFF